MPLLAFQQEDVTKLKSKRSRLVGNDPGTGKTYIGVALDQANRAGDGNDSVHVTDFMKRHSVLKTLVVCPRNAIDVWDEHLMELTRDDIYIYQYKNRDQFMKYAKDPRRGGYFVVNYDSVRIKDLKDLQSFAWFHIIGDEIHRIKNRKAQITVAFKKIPSLYKTGMSGTPADNKPDDIWSVLNWLWPKFYTSYWKFVKAYMKRVPVLDPETGEDTGYDKLVPNEQTLPRLREEMDPWFTRRKKEDVLTDLPPKYYTRITVDLHPRQRQVYDQMKKTMIAWCEQHEEEIERQDPIIAQAVVAQLIRLQQMTAGYLVPLIDPETGEQVVKIRKKWNKDHTDYEEVEVPQWKMIDPSAKLDAIMELLKDRGDEPVIVFSQSKAAIHLLGERLEKAGITYGLYTGDTKQGDRDQLVRDFQAGEVRVFAGTIKAGGEAITLTRASTVVFIDRWWSPSKNIQAEDRAHRIGQPEAVQVIDIVAKNTVDLGRLQSIKMKWKWLQMLMGDIVPLDQIEIDLEGALDIEQEEE